MAPSRPQSSSSRAQARPAAQPARSGGQPDSRPGRMLFGALVALGAAFVQFKLFRTNGLLWSLAACSFFVPALDWLLPGKRYAWRRESISIETSKAPNYEPIPGNSAGGAVRAGAG